jgi:stress response protein YsnF
MQRPEARVEREPVTDEMIDQAISGPEIIESEHEVALHAEEPVVEKRTVPEERVRLDNDVDTEERTVDEQVRKERIEPTRARQDASGGGRSRASLSERSGPGAPPSYGNAAGRRFSAA